MARQTQSPRRGTPTDFQIAEVTRSFHPHREQINDGAPRMRNYIDSGVGSSGCLESSHGVGVGVTDGECGLLNFIFYKDQELRTIQV